ncbi:HET-domain-containing protein [Xylariaceae sp. AK1471]|nr:HET-domain-containing protein [Xylariaceae sp. AK1471]
MRLINTHTFCLEEFLNENGLQYAILSHRWEDGEVTLQDMESGCAQGKQGYVKIKNFCEQARRDDLSYAWVDTCCIDKKNGSELSEAINSMYRWYQKAKVCYAFLSDVEERDDDFDVPPSFKTSVWFSRGWTLQELLAPKVVEFYDCSWQFFGTKKGLTSVISEVTKISESVLKGASVQSCSIAQRMSWAAHRETTRVEDRAYSLLGLFDVTMPFIYGEGEKAFIRLQQEIIRISDDHSIFVWSLASLSNYPGLLAPSPDAFANSSRIEPRCLGRKQSSYTMTNRGLSITLQLTPWAADTYLALLECVSPASALGPLCHVGIFLRRLRQDDQYARITLNSRHYHYFNGDKIFMKRPLQAVTINVKQNSLFAENDTPFNDRIYGYRIRLRAGVEMEIPNLEGLVEVPYNNAWNPKNCIMKMREGGYGTTGVVDLGSFDKDVRKLKLGFDFDHNPLLFVAESEGLKDKVSPSALSKGSGNASHLVSFDTSNCLDHNGRSNASPLKVDQLFVKGKKGFWAVRGDRIHGLNVALLSRNRSLDHRVNAVWIKIQRGTFEEEEIWEVKVSGLEPPPNKPQFTARQVLRKFLKRK